MIRSGILGQGYDRSNCTAVDGARDDYGKHSPSGVFSTSALAEGAIEGTEGDYRVDSPFAISFRYSRFGVLSQAPPRSVMNLTGRKRRAACARAPPPWDRAGGRQHLVDGLNFQGNDLPQLGKGRSRAIRTPEACYDECEHSADAGCVAFTFIKGAKERGCWLKHANYWKTASYSAGTISGVIQLNQRQRPR